MRIGFVGGGTGGHFYPLIAVAEKLVTDPSTPELYYFGPTPYNQDDLTTHNITFVKVPAGKLRRYFSFQNILDLFRNFFGIFVAIWKLFIIYPDVIFSKGGYTSVPILLAARFLRIPVVIHESDAVPGRANNLAKSFARYVAISYDDAAQFFPAEKTALTGIPLRESITATDPEPFTTLKLDPSLPLIYVTGGSTGAERINNLIVAALPYLLPHYQILHQTGLANETTIRESARAIMKESDLLSRYFVVGTASAEVVSAALTGASLVVSRAGSTSIFEIAAHGKPSIVIPIPEAVSHDQRTNAYAFARSGAATVLEEENLTEHLLVNEISSIMGDQTRYQKMAAASQSFAVTGAAEKISSILVQIGTEHGS